MSLVLDKSVELLSTIVFKSVNALIWLADKFFVQPTLFIVLFEYHVATSLFGVIYNKVVCPLYDVLEPYGQRFLKVQLSIVKYVLLFIIAFSIALSVAVLTYFTFYYFFVPEVYTEENLYFDYSGVSPVANFTLHDSRFFYPGQVYELSVQLEMPESPSNRDLGIFMVSTELYNSNNCILLSSRPAMLKYRSRLLRWMSTIAYSFPLLIGMLEEKQYLNVVTIESLQTPFNEGRVILSSNVQLYSAKLIIHTKLYGLRYLCYHWFFTSSVLGIFYIFQMEVLFGLFVWLIASQSKPTKTTVTTTITSFDNRPSLVLKSPKINKKDAYVDAAYDEEIKKPAKIKPHSVSPKISKKDIQEKPKEEKQIIVKEEVEQIVETTEIIKETIEPNKEEPESAIVSNKEEEIVTTETIIETERGLESGTKKNKLRKRKKKNTTIIQ